MATRRTPEGPRFDHGAQYFTVRDDRFDRYVKSWLQDGIVAPWEGRIVTLVKGRVEPKTSTTPRFVGVPGMNAVCKHLATDLDVEFETRVATPDRVQGLWGLADDRGRSLGQFDYVISSAPAPQSAELLAAAPELQRQAGQTRMRGCWAAMLALNAPLELPFEGAFVHHSPLSWIARSDTKPQRGNCATATDRHQECWVLHASPDWTEQFLEAADDVVLEALLAAFWQATGVAPRRADFATAHRWRYAIPPQPLEAKCLFDAHLQIGACGDWCGGPRVEGAFLSGMAMAERLLATLRR
jgi:predicted NAD/FAD-dependent oxidoreductase